MSETKLPFDAIAAAIAEAANPRLPDDTSSPEEYWTGFPDWSQWQYVKQANAVRAVLARQSTDTPPCCPKGGKLSAPVIERVQCHAVYPYDREQTLRLTPNQYIAAFDVLHRETEGDWTPSVCHATLEEILKAARIEIIRE